MNGSEAHTKSMKDKRLSTQTTSRGLTPRQYPPSSRLKGVSRNESIVSGFLPATASGRAALPRIGSRAAPTDLRSDAYRGNTFGQTMPGALASATDSDE